MMSLDVLELTWLQLPASWLIACEQLDIDLWVKPASWKTLQITHYATCVLNITNFFLQNQKFTYFWQFRTLGQSTSSEMTCLIQLPMIATWWRPHGNWWRQKRIVNMWQKVGPLVSIHSVRCSPPNPSGDHRKLDQASHFWGSTLTESTKLSKVSELLVLKEEICYVYISTNLMNLYKDTCVLLVWKRP